MRNLEQGPRRESLDAAILSVAHAYGFSGAPLSITRNDLGDVPEHVDRDVALIATLAGKMGPVTQTTQAWATAKKGGGTTVVFAAASPKPSIAQAFVVKAALATVESAGFENPLVLVSSVGDQESRRRYVRELGNFFKKNAKDISEPALKLSVHDPDSAARMLIEENHPTAQLLPRTVDYLSEPSRKIMLETISLFEALGIQYELDPYLPYTPDVQHELVFAIEGYDRKGNRVRVATGGRVQEEQKKKDRVDFVGMSVALHEQIDIRPGRTTDTPACFVVHVGEAAKLKAFVMLDSLWRAHIALGQALLSDTIQEQMQHAHDSGAKYIAIVGQREALDNTVIIKNTASQMQETIDANKLVGRMSRVRV